MKRLKRFKYFKLNESNIGSKILVSVDIQPYYEKGNWITFSVTELLEWIKGEDFHQILWLYNGPEMGFEGEEDINYWLMDKVVDYDEDEFGESFDFFSDIVTYYEKGYGFLRDLMDNDINKEQIVEIGKYMIKKDIRDMREFEEEDIEFLSNKGIDEEYLDGDDHLFYLPEVKDELNYLRGGDITLIGGGQNECLLEVEFLMHMLEIPYKIESSYVY